MEKIAERSSAPWLRPELIASWREIGLTCATFTAYFLSFSITVAIARIFDLPIHLSHSNQRLLGVAGLQAIMLAALMMILYRRGWKLADLNLRKSWLSTVLGVAFGFLLFGLFLLVTGPLAARGLLQGHSSNLIEDPSPAPDTWVVVLRAVVNAYYEEIIFTAYAFTQFAAKLGAPRALALIVLLRASFHLWKDPYTLAGTVVHFTILTLIYWRTRSLWFLIVSHAVFDLA